MAGELNRLKRRVRTLSGQEDLNTVLDLLKRAAELLHCAYCLSDGVADKWLDDFREARE